MANLKALLVNGRIVTGVHHGDAFSKLSEDEKTHANIISGFYNPQTSEFANEDGKIYIKKIIMIRHAKPEIGFDPILSQEGKKRGSEMAKSLISHFDLNGFVGFCSPMKRCIETTFLVARHTSLSFKILPGLVECSPEESSQEFCGRINEVFHLLPARSVIITHCDCIGAIVGGLGIGDDVPIPTSSVTLIENNEVVFTGRELKPDAEKINCRRKIAG